MKLAERKFKTWTYQIIDTNWHGFMVDIVDTGDSYEAWLYNNDYGIKEMFIGVPHKRIDTAASGAKSVLEFEELVLKCLADEDRGYIASYVMRFVEE